MSKLFKYLFLFTTQFSLSQNSLSNYFQINSVKLNDSVSIENINKIGLLNYQAYFFGEDHSSKDGPYKEILMINLLKKKVKTIFIEYPVDYNSVVKEYLDRSPIDTTTKDFELYSGNNKGQEILLRYVYLENLRKVDSLKLNFFHIDMLGVNWITIDDMLWFFKKRIKSKSIKEGCRYLKDIKKKNIKNEDSLIHQYLLFRENFYNNLPLHCAYLKKYFIDVRNNIDGIYTYSIARKEDTICSCRSNAREEFMLKNIIEQLKEDSVSNFISINGAIHVPLNVQYDFELMKEWMSLAARFKKINLDSQVCSIYFMDKTITDFEDKYFPNEKKLILENTKPGETYLIRLDGENTPFKELSEKFQYIVVW